MKKFLILFLMSMFLYGCPVTTKAVKNIPQLLTDYIPIIIKKLDEYFPSLSKYLPQKISANKSTVITKKFNNYPIYLQWGMRDFVLNICNEEKEKTICDEISTWKIPKGIFKTEPTYEDRIAYQLSCVAIIRVKNKNEEEYVRWSWGTGFYYDKNKLITNQHVITSAEDIYVLQFTDYIELKLDKNPTLNKASLIKSDPGNDIAILETKTENFSKCEFSNESPDLLSEVIAIGHPNKLFYTLSKGDINAFRDKENNFIQNKDSLKIYSIHMDAPIYPGSSGGPLFYKGKVVGVNFAGHTDTTLNFSIHFNVVKRFIK